PPDQAGPADHRFGRAVSASAATGCFCSWSTGIWATVTEGAAAALASGLSSAPPGALARRIDHDRRRALHVVLTVRKRPDPLRRPARMKRVIVLWLLDCRASLAMTGRVRRRPLPVIARRSCAVAIQSFDGRCRRRTEFESMPSVFVSS